MFGLDLVTQQAAAPSAQATDEPKCGKAGETVGADVAAAIEAAIEEVRRFGEALRAVIAKLS